VSFLCSSSINFINLANVLSALLIICTPDNLHEYLDIHFVKSVMLLVYLRTRLVYDEMMLTLVIHACSTLVLKPSLMVWFFQKLTECVAIYSISVLTKSRFDCPTRMETLYLYQRSCQSPLEIIPM